jgi:hypothetical protein
MGLVARVVSEWQSQYLLISLIYRLLSLCTTERWMHRPNPTSIILRSSSLVWNFDRMTLPDDVVSGNASVAVTLTDYVGLLGGGRHSYAHVRSCVN